MNIGGFVIVFRWFLGSGSSVRLYIHPPPLGHPARPVAQPARHEVQPARPEAQPARSEALPASLPSLRLQAWLAGPQAWLDGPEGGANRRTNEQMNGQKISPFYRTSSPIGAAAQKGEQRVRRE